MAVKERTETDILAYLKSHAVDGKITKSLLEIAEEVGYSNATVHRTLMRFQSRGIVQIDRTDCKANEPSVIYYLGPQLDEAEVVLQKGIHLATNLKEAADILVNHLENTTRNLQSFREDAESWRRFQRQIVGKTSLPHGLQLITIRVDDGPVDKA